MKRTAASVAFASLFFSLPLFGQAAGPVAAKVLKVAVIDTEKVLLNSAIGKAALAELKKMQERKEAEIVAKRKAAKDLQAKIAEGRLSLSKDRLSVMNKQLEDLLVGLERFQDDSNRELAAKKDEVLASIDARIMPVINQVAKEQKYSFIFRKFESGLIFADDSYDITNVIIQRLDAVKKP
jgi:outer membrane protein